MIGLSLVVQGFLNSGFACFWRALCLARSLTRFCRGPVCRGGAALGLHRREGPPWSGDLIGVRVVN